MVKRLVGGGSPGISTATPSVQILFDPGHGFRSNPATHIADSELDQTMATSRHWVRRSQPSILILLDRLLEGCGGFEVDPAPGRDLERLLPWGLLPEHPGDVAGAAMHHLEGPQAPVMEPAFCQQIIDRQVRELLDHFLDHPLG